MRFQYAFDTIRYVDDQKSGTESRRSMIASRTPLVESCQIQELADDFQYKLAELDSALFSPRCLQCGERSARVLQFERKPHNDWDLLPGNDRPVGDVVISAPARRHSARRCGRRGELVVCVFACG